MTWGKVKLGEVCTIEKGNIGIVKAIPGEYPLIVLGAERKTHNEFQFDDEVVIRNDSCIAAHFRRNNFETRRFPRWLVAI